MSRVGWYRYYCTRAATWTKGGWTGGGWTEGVVIPFNESLWTLSLSFDDEDFAPADLEEEDFLGFGGAVEEDMMAW